MTNGNPANDLNAIMAEHANEESDGGWYCYRCDREDHREPCLPYRLAERAQTAERAARDAEASLAPSGRPDGCICDYNPDTTDGPDECCPHHGRPYAYWVEGVYRLAEQLRDAEAKVAAAQRVLGYREQELLALKGACRTSRCRLHYAHSGPCDIRAALAGDHA